MKKNFKESEYPVFEIVCDDTERTGIRLLSIVDEPAIEMMGVAFNKEGSVKDYQFKANEDKQVIVGPAMVPNKKILRKDEEGNYYYNIFKPETIVKLVQKFNSQGTNRRINVDHSNRMVDAYIMENWIVEDQYYDKCKMYGFNVPVGTWMVSIKIEDSKFWKTDVKELGKFGFSIEGVMGERPLEYSKVMTFEEIIDGLTDDEIITLMNEYKPELVKRFKIEKQSGETKNEFISRCVSEEMSNGHEQSQALAICYTYWEGQDEKAFKKWKVNNVNSSNVKKMMYNDETNELVIKFEDGSIYTYSSVDFDLFKDVWNGAAACVSDDPTGQGRWWVGKSPSVGAAVYQKLVVAGVPYTTGGQLN